MRYALFVSLALGFAMGAHADDCSQAQGKLEDLLASFPKACKVDVDCEGHYYRVDACAAPVVTSKRPLVKAKEQELLRLQSQVRAACSEKWSHGPACSPVPYNAQCVQNRCTDKMRASTAEAAASGAEGGFKYGFAQNSCAPWDGPAIAFELTKTQDADENAPRLWIHLWHDLPRGVLEGKHTYELAKNMNGSAILCRKEHDCENVTEGTLTLDSYDGNGARGSYELKFKDGTVLRDDFEVKRKEVRMMCG